MINYFGTEPNCITINTLSRAWNSFNCDVKQRGYICERLLGKVETYQAISYCHKVNITEGASAQFLIWIINFWPVWLAQGCTKKKWADYEQLFKGIGIIGNVYLSVGQH